MRLVSLSGLKTDVAGADARFDLLGRGLVVVEGERRFRFIGLPIVWTPCCLAPA